MSHTLSIHHLGPIDNCTIEVKDFTVLTGPQSSGKSTIAKAIFFFRTVKQDLLTIMKQGGPSKSTGNNSYKWAGTIKQRLRNKFLELFGTSWIMPMDMTMRYIYSNKIWIEVFLEDSTEDYDKNYVMFSFSPELDHYINELNSKSFEDLDALSLEEEDKKLSDLFNDEYETVFIPAGRNLITLLSAQLNYIFTSLEGSQLRNIDYVTKRYTELILRIKPSFSRTYSDLVEEVKSNLEPGRRLPKSSTINLLIKKSKGILKGNYRYVDGEERLYFDESNPKKYIKINFTSSGQQEIVWVFNLLLYYLLEDRKVFLIIEEPESHLFPDAQRDVAEVLALFSNAGNHVLVTTHSPYVLGTFNYLMLASQVGKEQQEDVKKKLDKKLWLSERKTSALFVTEGTVKNAVDDSDGLVLIQNELIDDAAKSINNYSDAILNVMYSGEADEYQ